MRDDGHGEPDAVDETTWADDMWGDDWEATDAWGYDDGDAWDNDWYGDYSSSSQSNPKGPSSGTLRVRRGAGWFGGTGLSRVSGRDNGNPDFRYYYIGFRLAL